MPRPQFIVPPGAKPRLPEDCGKDPVYNQRPIAPIHLSGSVLLQAGASAGISEQTLMNPMGADMEILEVKFEVVGDSDLGVNASGVPFGGSVACSFKLGAYKITNGSVPIWCFGRAENLPGELKTDSQGFSYSYATYLWRLPRPLFVPAGSVLQPNFNHLGFLSSDLNVRVSYSARSVDRVPKSVCLPWVSAYTSRPFNPISAAGTDASQPQNLINDTPHPFNLQRFTGRTMWLAIDGTASESEPPSFASQYLTARIMDSYGRPIVRTYSPFRSVFGSLTRSWEAEELGAQLDPGGFYRVFLKKAAMSMASAELGLSQAQAFVGMVGWREVPV